MVLDTSKHYPVLLNEIISIISPQHGGTFIDCTFGQGGYTKKILSYKNTKVIALDRDNDTKKIADEILSKYQNRFLFKNKKFSQLNDLKLKKENVRGIIFDLGYSLKQIQDLSRGLSFNSNGELNMRLGLNDFSAKDAINQLDVKELENIIKFFGEDKDAKKIAQRIAKERLKTKINTKNLVELIEGVKKKKFFKIHSATKVFQALRMFVNKEITELINGLVIASKILKKDGFLVVVTFHSIEDRIVKYFFKSLTENKSISRYLPKIDEPDKIFKNLMKKPIIPSKKEIYENVRSRSAKLRYIVKTKDVFEFETDVFDKFKSLIEIENFGNKL